MCQVVWKMQVETWNTLEQKRLFWTSQRILCFNEYRTKKLSQGKRLNNCRTFQTNCSSQYGTLVCFVMLRYKTRISLKKRLTLASVGTTRSITARAMGSVADLITFSSSLIAAKFIGHSAMSLSGFRMLMHILVSTTRASTVVQSSVALSTWHRSHQDTD